MRTFALIGAAVFALSAGASNAALAWQTEQSVQPGGNATDFSDPEKFQALQDKVNAKTSSNSGFYFHGGVNSGADGLTGANPYGVQTLGRGSAFSYSPMPGFRGQPQ